MAFQLTHLNIRPVPLAAAVFLASHGLRKGSLSASGAAAALLVGYLHLANDLKVFGVALIAFYLIGSRATKVNAAKKASLEEGHDVAKAGGNRNAVQVLSNSLASLIAAVVFKHACSSEAKQVAMGRFGTTSSDLFPAARPCAIAAGSAGSRLPKMLIYAALGHFATCLGDTLASELGILSSTPPILITTLRTCRPGTNGGVSALGLGMSVLGGALMGGVFAVDLWLENGRACGREGYAWAVAMVLWGSVAGLLGSAIDSILGATLQQTLVSRSTGKIQTSAPMPQQVIVRGTSTAPAKAAHTPPGKEQLEIVCGLDVLDNSQVNLLSSLIMAGVMAWMGSR